MTRRRASPVLIGAFVVGGLALVIAAVIAAAGGSLFARTERAVLHFSGSIYGLQVGAPVVFRGVRVGSVTSIGLVYDGTLDEFSIPVVIEIERDAVQAPAAAPGEAARAAAVSLPALVERGLQGQLQMQSLLTGQLYVDLDLRRGRPAPAAAQRTAMTEIPTAPTAIQNLKRQLDDLDVRALVDDVAAIASAARQVVTGPQLQQALSDTAQIAASVRRLADRLDRSAEPLVASARQTLADTSRAAERLGRAADAASDTAARWSTTADRAGALVAPDSELVASVQAGAEDLARTAAALRRYTSDEQTLLPNLDQALVDLARAARAVRELAELLDTQPDALLRGRAQPNAGDGTP